MLTGCPSAQQGLEGYSLVQYVHVFWNCSLFSIHSPDWTLVERGLYGTTTFKRNDTAEKGQLYEKSILSFVKQLKNK